MSFSTIFYTIIIKPLELLFEVVYYNANKLIHDPGLSIVFLSLAVNFLILPLYQKADKMQEEEKKVEEKLKDGVSHIKKTFRGNERFYMIQTYYRQNGYKPVYALRGAVPLLLEIPFFIAAYHFLSTLNSLHGISFGPIADLGAPDAMIAWGDLTINVLPILMTVINIISGAIYAERLSKRGKIQLVVLAAVFLVLLYGAPAGLVFYWTLNNLFSLVKNIFYKLKNPKRVLLFLFALAGAGVAIFSVVRTDYGTRRRLFLLVGAAVLLMPLVVSEVKKRFKVAKKLDDLNQRGTVSFRRIFFLSGLYLSILLGLLIPGNVVASSVSEFVDVDVPHSPISYVWVTFLIAVGYFIVWFGVIFFMADVKTRKYLAGGVFCFSTICTVNYMLFNKKAGTMSDLLQFDEALLYSKKEYAINLLTLVAIVVLCVVLVKWNKKLVFALLMAGVIAVGIPGIKNIININRDYKTTQERITQADKYPTLTFSKTGKNVVVLMVDSLVSYYVPYMFYEKPELMEAFDGFTFYPNTISFGCQTIFGSPGLYGGYEYTPKEMNQRDQELLVEKQNEALRIMPAIFYQDNYAVTVCDPTYAGYNEVPDLTIYDDYPGMETYVTMGRVGQNELARERIEETRSRNFFLYSVFGVCPSLFQLNIYDGGNYCSTRTGTEEENRQLVPGGQVMETLSIATGVHSGFMKQYNVMNNLENISETVDDGTNHFIMMSNSLPHNPMLVKEPEYEPLYSVDNTEYDKTHHIKDNGKGDLKDFYDEGNYPRYQANMTAMLKLAEWFSYLKEEGIWDNTRIIIVSDHARRLGDLAGMRKYFGFEVDRNVPEHMDETDFSVFNCTLLVKDFGASGFVTEDTFMTNADVPTLAFRTLIDNPINPFTGKPIDSTYKMNNRMELFMGKNYSVYSNNGYTFQPDHWFSVRDNIFDLDNWEYIGYR